MNVRQSLIAVSAAVLVITLAGCAAGGSQATPSDSTAGAAKKGGHLVVAISGGPDTLDPAFTSSKYSTYTMRNWCEGLYDVDSKLNIVPQLAAALPTISSDGKTYTIKLRPGLKFNDGTDFNAEAVKENLDRYRTNPRSAEAPNLVNVVDTKVINTDTVQLDLSAPTAPLTSVLANRSGMMASPTQLKKLGDNFGNDPVCVGPFSFVSRPSADTINLKKSEYYYDKDKVNLDTVTFQVITQPNIRATNLRSGDIQAAIDIAPADVASLKSDPNITMDDVVSLGFQLLTVNVANSGGSGKPPYSPVSTPLANANLRKAFELTLDRNAINKVVYGGFKTPGCSPLSPASPWYTNIPCSKQDVAQAKKIVAASGVKTPIPVVLTIQAANDEQTKLGTVIQAMAKAAGFEVSIKPTESAAGGAAAMAGTFDAYMNGWSGRIDPAQNMSMFWSPKSALNYTGADYKDINDLMAQAAATTGDDAKRKQLYAQIAEKMNQDRNYIVLFHDALMMGVRKDVTGINYYSDGVIRLKTAGFTTGG
jgi:peptide/nickel transport system substrate-binding protein